ncbi:pilus assembly protein [Stenotrophomonas sp. ISL-67]|uniref:pilus assembly protein n=1 Tax=Stenotrophomonas sp. ISL-67 TaxID=2819171 RepID=UPI001BE7A5FF|nr:PilC/PilY family type IV pilus protein [Stenotrophomonas sp. ISL-67]MBT2766552.1 pilus assembly protein [Stenotrophomonas sp. ISL-67]
MATRRFKWMAAGSTVAAIGLAVVGYNLIAAQGQGTLAQEPLATRAGATPSFIMAVDDSGSMNFQTQFPGRDGEGCWNTSRQSFFDANGQLNTSGSCDYFFVVPGPRINNYYGVPPINSLGFARSAAYNPSYYDPTVLYGPWAKAAKDEFYPESVPTAALINPQPNGGTTTVNLVENYFSTAGNDSFRMQTGMVIPAGTLYRYNNTNYRPDTDYTWPSGRGAANIAIEYVPATFYVPWTSDTDPRPQLVGGAVDAYANATRVRVDNACGTGCSLWKYTLAGDTAASRNFANWYTYYGNRNRAMIAGMTRSLTGVTELNVGYFRINQHASFDSGTNANKRLTMRSVGNDDERAALYADMLALTANGGTPNRQAVNAAALQFTRTDDGAPITASCQKNAVMLFTDGFSNGGGPTVGNNDQNMGTPFSDGNSDTMADIVSRFYVNNGAQPPLRPDLPAGKVPVPEACGNGDLSLDCQTNLHLNFYGVTLGARGDLFNPDLDQNPYTNAAIYGNWPPRQDDERSTVDDIWHAAVNTRGEYINARTPVEITNAMSRVLQAVGSDGSPSSGSGASGARIGVGSITAGSEYKIEKEGTDWSSTLNAKRLSLDPTTRALVETDFWEASANLQSAATRRIFFTRDGTTREFTSGNVSLTDLCTKNGQNGGMLVCEDKLGMATDATAVSYLRGDVSLEKRNAGPFRDRTTRLGDIVTSTPVITSPIDDFGYRRLGGTLATTYATYLTNKATNGQYMVYAGANDGMLHAFNGGMDAAGGVVSGGGTEAFAYIPSTALGHMGNLLIPYDPTSKVGQVFSHRYYVDGQIAVADSYYDSGWHTTLVGASGAGGRSVFGLDVTTGSTFDTASKLWEISDLDTNLPADVRDNIGFVLGKPVIVPVLEGGNAVWKAIFGNGFNSASGKAVLFVVDIATGSARMIEAVESGSGVPAGSNGLASIVVIDRWGGTNQDQRTRDGYSDTVYGTDQKGALWKFDLRATGNLTTPLFTTLPATTNGVLARQPITGGITAGTGSNGGVMLYFGTGSYSFTDDPYDNSLQSLYAVNDLINGPITTALARSNLSGSTANIVGSLRTLTAGTPPADSRGWYIDLDFRERFVGNPSLSNGIVYMPTYIPRDVTDNSSSCAVPGDNWLFGLQPLTGAGALGRASLGSPTGTPFETSTAGFKSTSQGGAPITNANAFGLPRQSPPALGTDPGGGPSAPPTVPGSVCVSGIKFGSDTLYIPYPCGRQSWRQIQ